MPRRRIKHAVGRPTRKPDADVLQFMLEKYNSSEIAQMFGVPSSTVRSWKCRDKKRGNGNV